MARTFTIAGRRFLLDRERVEAALEGVLPQPIREHFVIIGARRFPPKQAIRASTGLDRADFTTHQARRILTRLGFSASRRSDGVGGEPPIADPHAPHGGRQAEALRPFVGRWVALGSPCEILVAAETPQEVVAWLSEHGLRAQGGMFRVPENAPEVAGLAPL